MERQDEQTGTPPAARTPDPAQPSDQAQPWTPPPAAERPPWSTRRTTAVTAVAAAAVLAVGGVAIAYSGSDSNTSAAAPGPGQGGGFPGGGFPGGGGQTGLASALHGTFVTRATDGSTVTQLLQTGSVTALGASSIAVRSTDGYAATYTLSAATSVNGGQVQVSAVAVGHTVTVLASEARAASTVLDQSLLVPGQGVPGQGGAGQGVPGQGVPGQGAPGGSDGTS